MTIFYNIWFFFFLFVFGLPLFMSLCLLCLYLCLWVVSIFFTLTHYPNESHYGTTDTINLFPALLTKTFLNFTLLFFLSLARCPTPLVPIMPNNQSTKKKLITTNSTLCLSLSISLIYINKRERVTNIEWQSHKAKKPKKKKKNHRQ